jgi:hypothetical protein
MTEDDRHDETLDRLVSHLTSVEPGEGFHERMLSGIVERRGAQERRPKLWMRWWMASAAAFACALVFAFVALLRPAELASPVIAFAPAVPQPSARAILRPTLRLTAGRRHQGTIHAAAHAKTPQDFPAPEAPLTAEEKLLLRVAHHPDPDEVALLDPAERAAVELRDQVQFQQFFDFEPRPKRDRN